MDISAGIQASLAGRYAMALFELASEQGTIDEVESDLGKLDAALRESPELRQLIANPELSRREQAAAMESVAQLLDTGDLSRRFLGVLAANRRLATLPAIIEAYRAIAAAQRGEITAQVVSAHPLSKAQLDELKARLAKREGRKVNIEHAVDPELLGGLVVTIGSRRIDGSIRTRLQSLANLMKEG